MKRTSKQLNDGNSFNFIKDRRNVRITKDNLVDYLLSTEEQDITSTFIMQVFGTFDKKVLCNPYDTITIPIGVYGKLHNTPNKNKFTTTVGLWIFNKYFIEPNEDIFKMFKYVNETINKKLYGKINQDLSYALIEDKIKLESLKDYLMKTQKFMPYETILTPNHSEEMLSCTKKINVLKKKLIKENQDKLNSKNNDLIASTAEDIEKQLIDYAMELLGDDPALDTFLSGAQGSIGNNFKNSFIMKGAVKDPITGEFKVIESNYIDGIEANEYSQMANSLAAGPYARSRKTASGGYDEKLFVSAYQHLTLDPAGSDCGTNRTVEVLLTEENIKDWMYNYIVSGSNTIELTSDNKDKYIGKKVKFRFSSLCMSKTGFCNKCAGNLFYRLGIKNVGLVLPQIPSTLKLRTMKGFHDSTISMSEMNIKKAFNV